MFTWRDLARIAKKVFTRGVITSIGLRDCLYVLLFLTVSVRGILLSYFRLHVSRTSYDTDLSAAYLILGEALQALTGATEIFPQSGRDALLNMIRDAMIDVTGAVTIIEGE